MPPANTATTATRTVIVANPDVTAPTVAVTAPTGPVSGVVSFSATASDNVGVSGVQFLVNGTPVGAEDTTSPYGVSFNTATVANGTYAVTARARDAAGNTTLSAPVSITVANSDTTAPTVSLTGLANGATVSGAVPLTANASDNVGVAGVQFLVNGIPVGAEDTNALDGYSTSWNTATVANGTYTVTVRARDAAGNATLSTPVTITVANGDVTAPSVTLTSPANGASVSGPVSLSANASDNVGVVGVQFFVDGVPLNGEDAIALLQHLVEHHDDRQRYAYCDSNGP